MNLRLHKFLASSEVDGPGRRAVVFVQGCPIRCTGCAVPWTWDEKEGFDKDVSEIAEMILDGPDVEGVTFLGGEPFSQAAALAKLGREVKSAGLSVVTFTGNLIEDIRASGDPDMLALLDVTDLLLDGPFVRELADMSRPWVGSSNQRFIYLTDRYKSLKDIIAGIPNRLEVRILPNGVVSVNGLIVTDDLKKFISKLID